MQADSFAAAARVGVEADHRGLLSDKKVLQLIKQWLGLTEDSYCLSTECTSAV